VVYLTVALAVLAPISLFVGVGQLSIGSLIASDETAWQLLYISRIPRLLAILLAGAGLSIAGLLMQQISQNRFASPSTSGTIECAMLGYLASLLLFGNGEQLWLIFTFACAGTLLFVSLINRLEFRNPVLVPLTGIVFGNLVDSVTTFLAIQYDLLQNLSSWTVANFANLLQGDYELLFIAIPVAFICYYWSTRLAAVGLGKDFATNLGLNYRQMLLVGVVLVSVMSASVVMIVGTLPFIGLVVPNLVSLWRGDNLRRNLPYCALLGALVVLSCDLVSRLLIYPYELPVSALIGVLAAALFIGFILRGPNRER